MTAPYIPPPDQQTVMQTLLGLVGRPPAPASRPPSMLEQLQIYAKTLHSLGLTAAQAQPKPQPTPAQLREEAALQQDDGKTPGWYSRYTARRDSIANERFNRLVNSPYADSLFQILGMPSVVRYGHDEMNALHGLTSGPLPTDTVNLYRAAMIGDYSNNLAHVTNTAEGLLAHEVAHHADDVDMQKSTPKGQSYAPTPLRQALDRHQLGDMQQAGNEYARSNTIEYRASVIANAIQYLRDTATLPPDASGERKAAALRKSYEKDVPGTADVVDVLIQHPLFAQHPLRMARLATRPDATAVRQP